MPSASGWAVAIAKVCHCCLRATDYHGCLSYCKCYYGYPFCCLGTCSAYRHTWHMLQRLLLSRTAAENFRQCLYRAESTNTASFSLLGFFCISFALASSVSLLHYGCMSFGRGGIIIVSPVSLGMYTSTLCWCWVWQVMPSHLRTCLPALVLERLSYCAVRCAEMSSSMVLCRPNCTKLFMLVLISSPIATLNISQMRQSSLISFRIFHFKYDAIYAYDEGLYWRNHVSLSHATIYLLSFLWTSIIELQ